MFSSYKTKIFDFYRDNENKIWLYILYTRPMIILDLLLFFLLLGCNFMKLYFYGK